jgi:DNA polymerase (family X)
VSPLSRALRQLASLAMIRGDGAEESVFLRADALTRAHGIESDADLEPLFHAPPPESDAETRTRLRHMFEAGGWVLVESAVADLPADLRWLYESDAVTIEQLAALYRATGATSLADLAAAVREQALRGVEGLDADADARIAAALPHLRMRVPRVPLGRATIAAEPFVTALRQSPAVEWVEPAGSLRRGQETVGDIEIVAATSRPAEVLDAVARLPEAAHLLHRSTRRLYALIERVQVGVRLLDPSNAGAALVHVTGSFEHVDALRAHAAASGLTLTPSRLLSADGTPLAAAREEEVYAALGLPFIPPEIRHGEDEIAAAARGSLPQLVTRRDIRGDLHMHSTWSDGRDPIDVMVAACVDLEYEYLAITDHSPHSAATRNLTVDGVRKQADEIAAARERYPGIAILHGCEVDILPDGRLDFADRVLERFDIVLVSLHESAGQPREQLMQRYLAAMKHPLVTIITHPTNRLVPNRHGYDLDYDALFAAAAETHTAIEIDGAPSHLDLDGALARRAIAAGAMVSIDSDCHRADMLDRQMQFGVMTARRGWVEARHVLNARPLADVREFIAAKRGGR